MKEHLDGFVNLEGKDGIEREDVEILKELVETALYNPCEKQRGFAKGILSETGNIGEFLPSGIHGADGHIFLDLWHPEYGLKRAYLGEAGENNACYKTIDLLER